MRVSVLFSRLSGYMAACLRELQAGGRARLQVICDPPSPNAPFSATLFSWIDEVHERKRLGRRDLQEALHRFAPDAILMAGWFDRSYLSVARTMRRRGIPVIAGSDAQWTGSLRQRAASIVSPLVLRSAIDVLWVAGERQREFGRRLGFVGEECWDGYYACDWSSFAAMYDADQDRPHSFLFVGRYVDRKGVDVLLGAYRRYRTRVAKPWPLICAGAGPLAPLVDDQEGVKNLGFVQPESLPALFGDGGVFILPSRVEPWGVVLQEAAAAGMPLICTEACGASVHLLRDGYNGLLVPVGDEEALAASMERLSSVDTTALAEMSRASHALSQQYTPERWARQFVNGVNRLRGRRAEVAAGG